MSVPLAGRFETYVPQGFEDQKRKILYIGKATDGSFEEEGEERRAFEKKKSHFWSFANEVSALADHAIQNRCNLAWSNIFKQGVVSGNPTGALAEGQRSEAIELLREEVQTLKPDLIVLVTVGYNEDIPKVAFYIADGDSTGGDDGKLHEKALDGQKYSIWWRRAYAGNPALVWMNHPQGKLRDYKDACLEVIADVTGWEQS